MEERNTKRRSTNHFGFYRPSMKKMISFAKSPDTSQNNILELKGFNLYASLKWEKKTRNLVIHLIYVRLN